MRCPKCGALGPAAAYFCSICGAPQIRGAIDSGAVTPRAEGSEVRVGIDRKSNALWLRRGATVRYVPQADRIWDAKARSDGSSGAASAVPAASTWGVEIRYDDGSVVRVDRLFGTAVKAIRCAEDIRQLIAGAR